MNKKVLMIAFHFPPVMGSSGLQRTLKFATYLKPLGWDPIILSISTNAYEKITPGQTNEIMDGIPVYRAIGFDTKKAFTLFGRYPRILALPDRFVTWLIGGVITGSLIIKKHSPDLIWSTYPIATAHAIASRLHRKSGIPWIADFRDSMTEDHYPSDPVIHKSYRKIEQETVRAAAKVVFTTESTMEMYRTRYKNIPDKKWQVIENGYDEENFIEAEKNLTKLEPTKKIKLLHSGLLYREERDPLPFFKALGRLKKNNLVNKDSLRVVLRAAGEEEFYAKELKINNIDDIVVLKPGIPYRDALQEMLSVDGLLLFQGTSCNHQIPAKAYEYIRASRPIFALTDSNGDTAKLLLKAQNGTISDMADEADIYHKLKDFLESCKQWTVKNESKLYAKTLTRKNSTVYLANLFNEIT